MTLGFFVCLDGHEKKACFDCVGVAATNKPRKKPRDKPPYKGGFEEPDVVQIRNVSRQNPFLALVPGCFCSLTAKPKPTLQKVPALFLRWPFVVRLT
jgi:hypothetical protein